MSDVLTAVLADSEREMDVLARGFEELAHATAGVLESAGAVVGCAEGEPMRALEGRLARLDAETRRFLDERLTATDAILETVTGEAVLLRKLERQTLAQRGIAREMEMLRVLTNIEVARLGEVGVSFAYLARELNDFSATVAKSTGELNRHTEERRRSVEETRRTLAAELPRMRSEFARTEEGLNRAVAVADSVLRQMTETSGRFRGCVEQIASEIAGVVAAIQSHDITRQQIEHVREALEMLAGQESLPAAERQAGLEIQQYQLRSIRDTVERWTGQIGTCLEGIGRIAGSEILDLAPAVFGEEQQLSSQLEGIGRLEAACARADAAVRASFAGISGLMPLVSEHLERSKAVRERLQLLMFNSIVEASHLGSQADGILEISRTIKRISAAWSGLTGDSEEAVGRIRGLVEGSGGALEVFAEGRQAALNEAEAAMQEGLAGLGEAARCAEERGKQIRDEMLPLEAKLAGLGEARDRLQACLGRLAGVLEDVERVQAAMPVQSRTAWDVEAMERRFAGSYTTEMERAVLRAALSGGPLPDGAQSFAGNDVELF
ncbi:MAG TPA: hypothetical protein VHX37_07395 [Acidobacteriaceae bacterium]|jgi:hypothetical protein|nr:hypothetical protein [Acidobacteriaceae bacterium]